MLKSQVRETSVVVYRRSDAVSYRIPCCRIVRAAFSTIWRDHNYNYPTLIRPKLYKENILFVLVFKISGLGLLWNSALAAVRDSGAGIASSTCSCHVFLDRKFHPWGDLQDLLMFSLLVFQLEYFGYGLMFRVESFLYPAENWIDFSSLYILLLPTPIFSTFGLLHGGLKSTILSTVLSS